MTELKPFSISRILNAPRDRVFQVWSEPKHLEKWMSGPGFKNILVHGEVKVGKFYHYGQQGPDGHETWGKQVYKEIILNEKIVCIQSFSDKDAGLSRHPIAPSWPLEMLSTVFFEDAGPGKTKITTTWIPYNSDDSGNSTFDSARDGMTHGFTGMFTQLENYLASFKGD